MTDKNKLQTYSLVIKDKYIEDIKKQPNTTFKEKNRHGGTAFKFSETNDESSEAEDDKYYDAVEFQQLGVKSIKHAEDDKYYDAVDSNDINNISWKELNWKLQQQVMKIQELEKENQELKQSKQSDINSKKYSYNAITIYDEKQRKKTGINNIHEEILQIENKILYITTFMYVNESITEKIIYLHNFKNDDVQVIQQLKNYKNNTEYENDTTLIEDISTNKKNVTNQFAEIKDFLKEHNDFKLKPTKKEELIWWGIIAVSVIFIILAPILINFALPAIIPAIATAWLIDTKVIITVCCAALGLAFQGFASIFSDTTKKVQDWWYSKICKNKKEKKKKEKNVN